MTVPAVAAPPERPAESYLAHGRGARSWLLTLDHKRIGVMYLAVIVLTLLLGGVFALVLRLNLWNPGGGLVSNDAYNKLFTLHGAVMIFLFVIPGIPASLGNFVLPLQLGAKDVAFPRLNLLSFWLYVTGAALFVTVLVAGGIDTGWTLYPPYSLEEARGLGILLALAAVFVAGFSSILTGVNFIASIHRLRPPGGGLVRPAAVPVGALRDRRHPDRRHARARDHRGDGVPRAALPPRALHARVRRRPGAVPALLLVLLAPGRLHHDPAGDGDRERGGLGLQPEAHLRLPLHRAQLGRDRGDRLPRMGPPHVRERPVEGRGQPTFSFLTLLVAIPSAIKVFNWLATMYKGAISSRRRWCTCSPSSPSSASAGSPGSSWHARHRRPAPRHLLRGGALPLRDDGRGAYRVHGRAALLVAQDDRPHVRRDAGRGSPR